MTANILPADLHTSHRPIPDPGDGVGSNLTFSDLLNILPTCPPTLGFGSKGHISHADRDTINIKRDFRSKAWV